MGSPGLKIAPPMRRADLERAVAESSKKLHGFKRKIRPHLPAVPPIFIFNVSDKTFKWHLAGFDFYQVNPLTEEDRKEGKQYSEPCIVPGICTEEVLEGESTQLNQYDGMEIANDIIGVAPGIRREADIRPYGVFISTVNPPKKEDVLAAQKYLSNTCELLVREGDRIHAQGESKGVGGQMISEDMRWASRFSRQHRDWNKATVRMLDCPACGQPVAEGVAMHLPHNICGAVIDWDKAIAQGLKTEVDRPKVKAH